MRPFLLLVEDDPTSREFLRAALRALPAEVDCAASAAQALECARARHHDLWLIDAHLPDGDGAGLLARLRSIAPTVAALAHTADTDANVLEALRSRGFSAVICKPLSAGRLQAIVRHHLGAGDDGGAPTNEPGGMLGCAPAWDDAAALAVLNGNATNLAALRGLFVADLPDQREEVVQAARSGDQSRMRAHLHRLRASCAFTGAMRLSQASRRLSEAMDCPAALAAFERAADATLAEAVGFPIPD